MGNIMIFGDICPDNEYRTLFDCSQYGPFSKEIAKDINDASFVIGNLECPATENMKPIVKCGPTLRAKLNDIELLQHLGFSALSLANNHVLDFGSIGVEDTITKCNSCRILTVGAGKDKNEAAKPLVVNIDHKTIRIFSFAEAEFNLATEKMPGANHFDPYSSFDKIRLQKKEFDYTIVFYHGGIEYYKYPSPLLQKKCRGFVEAGADLVVCQHSHCIGTREEYNQGTIIYGQGNSIFGYKKNNETWNEGLIVLFNTETGEISFRIINARENGVGYAIKTEEEIRLRQFFDESQLIGDPRALKAEWNRFCAQITPLDMPLLYGKNRIFIKMNRILNNKLVSLLIPKDKQMITMNLLRCEAHHEVIKTILENKVFGSNYDGSC